MEVHNASKVAYLLDIILVLLIFIFIVIIVLVTALFIILILIVVVVNSPRFGSHGNVVIIRGIGAAFARIAPCVFVAGVMIRLLVREIGRRGVEIVLLVRVVVSVVIV